MFDTINKENLEKFVDIFYNKARKDKDIGPTFNAKIDSEEKWKRHKAVASSFWLARLTGEQDENAPERHKGGIVGAHQELPPFPREYFGVWLKLFEETLNEFYNEECKAQILAKANGLSERLQGTLYEGKSFCTCHQKKAE